MKVEAIESEQRFAYPFRFPGQYEDAKTGLHCNRHRHYDPLTAQYISPDPIGLEGDRPQGYVENPAAWTDPPGLAVTSNRTIGDDGRPPYRNLYPRDLIPSGGGNALQMWDGSWRIVQGDQLITPRGTYALVTKTDGTIIITKKGSVKGEPESSHLRLSRGQDVRYAGTITFSKKDQLLSWDNATGHYGVLSADSIHSGLPPNLFRPYVSNP